GDLGVAMSGRTTQSTECCDALGNSTVQGEANIQAESSYASWTDKVSINDSRLPVGAPIYMRANLSLKGILDANANGGSAFIQLGVFSTISTPTTSSSFNSNGQVSASGTTKSRIPYPEVIPLLYPIVNGIENDLTVSLILSGDARSTTDPRAA